MNIYLIIPFMILISLELLIPKRKFPKKLIVRSYLTDLLIVIFNNAIFFLFSIGGLYAASQNIFSLNLLSDLDYSNIAILIAVLIFLDLMAYIWHLLNHKLGILWTFHKTHHTELYLNTLSGLRFHIGELFLSVIFKSIVLIMILGIPIDVIVISESLVILFSMFHHSNIQFKGEKLLSKAIIIPYIHQAHHTNNPKEYGHNFGVIFSTWDRIFKTLLDKEIKMIGLGKIKFQNFLIFLGFGFKYRY